MYNFPIKFLLCFFIITIHSLQGNDYKIDIPNAIIAQSRWSEPLSINAHDDVLIEFHTEGGGRRYAVWSSEGDIEILPRRHPITFWKLGNSGAVLGNRSTMWSYSTGIQKIDITKDIPDVKLHSESPKLIDINSFGQIIGTYQDKDHIEHSFIWENGRAHKFSIDKEAVKLGYQISSTSVLAINDRGSILGSFKYGSKHPLKDSWIVEGSRYFLMNKELHLIDSPEETEMYSPCMAFQPQLNNNDQVLMTGFKDDTGVSKTYLWNEKTGKHLISDNLLGVGFNDSGQIVGGTISPLQAQYMPCIFDQGQLIELDQVLQDFGVTRLNRFPKGINNNGVTVFQGQLWGECHAIRCTPIGKNP